MLVALVVVIAVASGLVSLNLFLIVAFCLLRQRKKDIRVLEDELGSLEDRLSPVKRIRSNPQIQRHHSRKDIGTQLQSTPPIVHRPTNATRLDTTDLLHISLLKPPLSSLPRPNDYLSVPANSGVSRAATQTERSEKTASIYSTESAPLHFHDQLSNPLFMSRVVMPNITKASLPRGMNLPSNVTRDIGLFIRPLPTANLPSNSSNTRLRDNTYARASAEIPNSHFDPGTIEFSHSLTKFIPHSARSRTTLVPQLPNRAQVLYRGINPQALRKTTSTSSFPPPLW